MKFLKPKFWDENKISLFSISLFPIALFIKLLHLFKIFFIKKYSCSIPVICVGNIYLGGTGKTPFCIELYSILKSLKKNPVFIRKKYKSFQDEINLLKLIGPTYESNKRVSAINDAIQNKANVVILDDGFQDFSVKKDLSIVCFHEKQWIGNGLLIPSGPLREGLSALNRAGCVIINGKKNIEIEKKILEKNKTIKIFYAKYEAKNIDEFRNKKIICFAGIGNPLNFFNLLKENNLNIFEQISFPDHYNYSKIELDDLKKKARKNNAFLLTTEKDHLRIDDNYKDSISYLKIKVEIKNKNLFIDEIKKII